MSRRFIRDLDVSAYVVDTLEEIRLEKYRSCHNCRWASTAPRARTALCGAGPFVERVTPAHVRNCPLFEEDRL